MKKYAFIALTAFAVLFTACNSTGSKKEAETTQSETTEMTVHGEGEHAVMAVGGSCDMCKDLIEKTASGVAGVTSVAYDLDAEQLHFHFDASQTNVETVSKALASVGYDTELDKAPDDVYNALPGCCKYREI